MCDIAVVIQELRMSPCGYKRRFRPRRRSDRSTPESRPSSGDVRFLGLEVRSTSDSRRRWARSARTGYDPNQTLALPKEVEHWSLTTLREKLVKIGAKAVRHGRYVTFQLAEVAVPVTCSEKSCGRSMIRDQAPLQRRPGTSTARRNDWRDMSA